MRAESRVYPATLGKNSGHAIGESLSVGCPVICSRSTLWAGVLNKAGGAALKELDTWLWANEIDRDAMQTRRKGRQAVRTTLASYAPWRRIRGRSSAVARAVAGARTKERGDVSHNRPHRIALVTQGYQSVGGVQTAARWLATGLRGAGFEVEIFDLATSSADVYSRRLISPGSWRRATLLALDSSEMHVTHVGANGVEFEPLRYLPRVEFTRELAGFDFVQVVAGGPALALTAIRSRRPIVLLVATTVAWERASQLAAGTAMALWRGGMTKAVSMMERAALQTADVVLVLNTEMQDFARSVGQTRVVITPPGVDTERFTPRTDGWNSTGYLLSVCRLNDTRKGLDRLIRSYALMTTLRPSVPALVLAGRGELPTSLMRLIAELGVAERISVRSDVPQAELPSLYRGASVYLQTSHEEGLGISVIEAMASGLPVVSTDTAGTRETVAHGDTGWLVNQGSEVESAIAERTISVWNNDAQAMSCRARSRAVSLFSDQATLSHFLEVYDQLIGSDGGRSRNR